MQHDANDVIIKLNAFRSGMLRYGVQRIFGIVELAKFVDTYKNSSLNVT